MHEKSNTHEQNTARVGYALWKLYMSLLLYAKHPFFGIGKLNLFVVEPWYTHTNANASACNIEDH